ncbi:MAG: hypothetical protein ACRECD_13215, partial [Burkholderiaceae bacterium]
MNKTRFLLNPQSLSAQVSAATFERGLSVYRNQQVLDYELFGVSSQEWNIEGDVQGSRHEIYSVSVMVEADPQGRIAFFSGDCSCPVGDNCKHSVALTLKAAYKSGVVVSPGASSSAANGIPGTPPLTPAELQAQQEAQQRATAERERQQAHSKVSQWLDLFGDDSSTGMPAHGQARPALPSDAEQVVYMLIPGQQGPHQVLQLGFGLSRRLRNGNWAKVKLPKYVDPHSTPAQDMDILHLINSLTAQTYSYAYSNYQGVLTGRTGLLALQLAAGTGRLFSISEDRVLDRPLSLGPARPMAWKWNEVTSPTAPEPIWALKPGLVGTDGETSSDADWFGNTPPLYLDADAGLCGPVEAPGISVEHLSLLLKAPPIPQSAFALHETTLLRRLAGLPLPPVLKAPEVLQGVAPRAHLHIAPVPAHDVPRLGLLCATLRFDYAGLRHYAPHAVNPVLIEREPIVASDRPNAPQASPQRLLLHRDLAAEQAAQNALHALGLKGDAAGQFHLPFASAAQQQPWLQWADQDFAPLREAGFVLDVDPRLTCWIARADALEVHLAPQDSDPEGDDLAGSDDSRSPWFDLSLGMDINGQRHNILPLLPELLAQLSAVSHGLPAAGENAVTTLQLPTHVFLRQENGNYLRLPTEPLRPWLQALLDLVGERGGHFDGDTLRLSRLEALRVGAALGEGAHWQGADSLRHMV